MSKFTKGPWEARESTHHKRKGDYDIGCGELYLVASVYDNNGRISTDKPRDVKANAHLIAASPDMYKILGDIQIALLQAEFESMFPDELKEIAAALAKARGELTK